MRRAWTPPTSSHAVETVSALAVEPRAGVRFVGGRTSAGDGGEGWFRWVGGDQSANVTIDPEQGIYVAPADDPTGASGAWVRVWQDFVKVEWFGAKGDAARPSESTGTPTGTDDTAAIVAACTFLQEVNFQPNFFVGNWGGYRLEFTANKAYRISGDNVLGTTRSRSTVSGDTGSLERQNWHINGNGCLLLWSPDTADDALIESHETFVRQVYENFTVVPCDLTGTMGWLYKNTANSGRNATHIHKFEAVQTANVGTTSASSATVGLKGLFRYEGDNLGDRLQTERCSFSQFETGFYSENGEAVSQHFSETSFTSYIDGATFFYIRKHGSGFSARGCEFLCKGDGVTLLKTEYLSGNDTGSNGAHVTMSISECRLEVESGNSFTMVDAEFGMIEVSDLATVPGGLPDATSELLIVKDSAVVTVSNCALYGRVVMGAPLVSNYKVSRRYQIMLKSCLFLMDLSQNIYVIDGSGTRVVYQDALIGEYERPALLVEDSNGRSVGWDGLSTDTDEYVFDGVYLGTNWPNLNQSERTIMCGRYRTASQRWYLDNDAGAARPYFVLPACCVITSMRLTRASVAVDHADELQVIVGNATHSVALDTSEARDVEVLSPEAIVVSGDDKDERTLSLQVLLASTPVNSPSVQGFLEVTYRQARGLNEIDTTEVGGVRQTRVESGVL